MKKIRIVLIVLLLLRNSITAGGGRPNLCQSGNYHDSSSNAIYASMGPIAPDGYRTSIVTPTTKENLSRNMVFNIKAKCDDSTHFMQKHHIKLITFWVQVPSDSYVKDYSSSIVNGQLGELGYYILFSSYNYYTAKSQGWNHQGFQSSSGKRWVFYAFRFNINNSTNMQYSILFVYRGLGAYDINRSTETVSIDSDQKRKTVLHKCTNLDMTKINQNGGQYFQGGEEVFELKTQICNFQAIKTVLIPAGKYQFNNTGQRFKKLYRSLMMGGFSRLVERQHFNNMGKDQFSKIMQGKFNYELF